MTLPPDKSNGPLPTRYLWSFAAGVTTTQYAITGARGWAVGALVALFLRITVV